MKNFFWHATVFSNLFLVSAFAVSSETAIPAFPEAQGGGAESEGGRGGAIIEVTNLNDSGAGSLRACVTASGPRTCVFRVSGDIKLKSELRVNNPYLTVAGQTSPGGGIQLSGLNMTSGTLVGIATHDVIWRYTRARQGYTKNCKPGSCGSNFSIYSGYKIMIDHNVSQWNIDEGFNVWQTSAFSGKRLNDITFSWNIGAEGLSPHSTAGMTGSNTNTQSNEMTNIDWHHNLFMNDSHRNPLLKNRSARYVNNLHYNAAYAFSVFDGGIRADIIGNKYKRGPLTPVPPVPVPPDDLDDLYEILAGSQNSTTATGSPSLYLSGNQGYHQEDPLGDQWLMARKIDGESCCAIDLIPDEWKRDPYDDPLDPQAFPIKAESVEPFELEPGLEASVLPLVGAARRLDCEGNWVLNRDSQEKRLIKQYDINDGITSLPVTENNAGGFPVIAPGIACDDTDHDGMPDAWEDLQQQPPLKKTDASDRNGIASNGYTNVENYLNGFGATSTRAEYTLLIADTGTTSFQLGNDSSHKSLTQSFIAPDTTLTNIQVGLAKSKTPSYPIRFTLKEGLDSNAVILYSILINPSQVTSTSVSNPTWVIVPIPPSVKLDSGKTYYLNLYVASTSSQNYYRWPAVRSNSDADGILYQNTTKTIYDALAKVSYLSEWLGDLY